MYNVSIIIIAHEMVKSSTYDKYCIRKYFMYLFIKNLLFLLHNVSKCKTLVKKINH